MRPFPPIVLVPSTLVGASYDAWAGKIMVSSRAANVLSKEELASMIAHEHAHRELWHIERALGFIAGGIWLLVFYVASGEPFLALIAFTMSLALYVVSRACAEFEADYVAVRLRGAQPLLAVFEKQAHYHPELQRRTMFLARRGAVRWFKERGW